jgi:hypothetical protein
MQHTKEDFERAMEVARGWVMTGKHFKVLDPDTIDGPCQIFRDTMRLSFDDRPSSGVWLIQQVEQLKEQHLDTICRHLILSRGFSGICECEINEDEDEDEVPECHMQVIRTLYGFLDRVGRLPIPGDVCSLGYLTGRFLRVTKSLSPMFVSEEYQILSEVCLHIDELATGEDPKDFLYEPTLVDVGRAYAGLSELRHNPFVPGSGGEW